MRVEQWTEKVEEDFTTSVMQTKALTGKVRTLTGKGKLKGNMYSICLVRFSIGKTLEN